MPISIRLLIFFPPDFAVVLKARSQPRPRAGSGGRQRERLSRALSGRLSPHLLRDVLPD